jgi:hypothetical protein
MEMGEEGLRVGLRVQNSDKGYLGIIRLETAEIRKWNWERMWEKKKGNRSGKVDVMAEDEVVQDKKVNNSVQNPGEQEGNLILSSHMFSCIKTGDKHHKKSYGFNTDDIVGELRTCSGMEQTPTSISIPNG